MSGVPVQPRPTRRNNHAATDKNPAMITPDAVWAIRSLWLAMEVGGPATKLDLACLRASQVKRLLDEALAALMLPIATTGVFDRLNVTARPVGGTWGP